MSKTESQQQLKKYAEDLQKIFKVEKQKRLEMENVNTQMKKYAEDLNRTILELKKANQKLHKQVEIEEKERLIQKNLIHINKMTSLGTLAAGIAHEINNPISYILGNSQILQELWEELENILKQIADHQDKFAIKGIPFEDITEMIPKILKNNIEGARQISLITGKLKDFSHQDNRHSTEKININRALEYTIAILDKQIKKSTTNFQLKLNENIPHANGNTHEMEQVFINIIQNALQSLPDTTHSVRIATSHNKKSNSVLVKIEDEGAGMSREVRERIMEPFFTTRESRGGTGLGLYISFSIIKKIGGDLEIYTEPGRGTEVIISLPAGKKGARP